MSEKKTRNMLSLGDKLAMFNFKLEHPESSFATIANIFSERFGKKINKTTVFENYRKIKKLKEEGFELNETDMMRNRLVPSKRLQFERMLYDEINRRLKTTPMNFQTIKIIASKLQDSADFQNYECMCIIMRQLIMHIAVI